MYYLLRLLLPSTLPADIREMYTDAVSLHNKNIDENPYFDAGFNLICPVEIEIEGFGLSKFDLGLNGAMTFVVENSRMLGDCDYTCGEEDFASVPVGYFPQMVIKLTGNIDEDMKLIEAVCNSPDKYYKPVDLETIDGNINIIKDLIENKIF